MVYNRLPKADQQQVDAILLLALARSGSFEIEVQGWLGKAGQEAATGPELAKLPPEKVKTVTAPLPGTITKVTVKVGDTVNAGDTVLLMEAMKMENNITAEFGGTVKAILVETGNQVQSGQALVELN